MIVWDLPLSRNSLTIGDCMEQFLADEECTRDCPWCDGKEAVMKKSVEKWPR